MTQSKSNSGRRPIVIIAIGTTIVVLLALGLRYSYCNVSFYRNDQGDPKGTGAEVFRYPDGNVKAITEYQCGEPTVSTWYKRDGSVFEVTKWDNNKGMWYFLRDDGTLKAKCMSVDDLMHGTMTYYDRSGNVTATAIMRRGEEVSRHEASPGSE